MKLLLPLILLLFGTRVGAATYTIKINAAVANSGTNASTTATTMYTGPSNGYAIVHVRLRPGSTGQKSNLLLATHIIGWVNNNTTTDYEWSGPGTTGIVTVANQFNSNGDAGVGFGPIYVGPSQVLAVANETGTGSTNWEVAGVEFTN